MTHFEFQSAAVGVRVLDRLERLWRMRKCFICENTGPCAHREFEADIAYLEAEDRRKVAA